MAAFLSLGRPSLTLYELTPQLWDPLHAAGIIEASGFTLHGLRRGAAQAWAARGFGHDSIKEQGMWTSTAVQAYVARLAFCMAPEP